MEPATPPPTPAAGEPLVEYFRTQRQNAAYSLLALAALLVALTVFLGLKAFRAPAAAEKPAEKPLKEDPLDPERLEPIRPASETSNVQRMQYMFGWVGTLLGAGVLGVCGAWLLAGVPPVGEEKQRAETRILLLAVGGLLGAILIVFGMIYFYLWSDSLGKWVDKRELKEARWVLIPLLIILAGAGLVFAAIQPARAEERNNSFIRRMVYGSNFALTALLLVVMLVVVNVLIAREVPNKLDTTSSGFYSLSDNTRNLLTRLEQPVTAYAVIPPGSERELNDVRQLLTAYQEASDGKFKAIFLSQVGADRERLATLRAQYPQFNMVLEQRQNLGGVLLTAGEGEKRHTVLSVMDFLGENRNEFVGESRLFKEVAFLADSQAKPVVYFMQGHGELEIESGPEVKPSRSASRLKDYLEKNYLDVRPLRLTSAKAAVPDDAAVVIIAEPTNPVPDAVVAALRKFMSDPAKKGKLIFLSGSSAGPDARMVKTGLEPLLAEFNVRLGTHFMYNVPNQLVKSLLGVIVGFSRAVDQYPVLQSISNAVPQMGFTYPREVETLKTNPQLSATTFLLTLGMTWLEEEKPADLGAAAKELESPAIQKRKQLSEEPRSVGVIVTEGRSGRVVAIGNSHFVTDEYARQFRQDPRTFGVIGASVDWLRDKETSVAVADIEAKKYTEFKFPPPAAVDFTRLVWLPLGLALLAVVGLGAGVWVIRRR